MSITSQYLPNAAGELVHSSVGVGRWVSADESDITIEAFLGANGGSATVEVQGANATNSPGSVMATFTLSGANDVASVYKPTVLYRYRRAVVTAISGGATCHVVMGGE